MHHGVEFHFRLAFSKVLRQGKLSVDAHADFSKIKFNTGDRRHHPASCILYALACKLVDRNIFITEPQIGCYGRSLSGELIKGNQIGLKFITIFILFRIDGIHFVIRCQTDPEIPDT